MPCPECMRILHTGEGRVQVGFTPGELADILCGNPSPTVVIRVLRAIKLLDAPLARDLARGFEVVI